MKNTSIVLMGLSVSSGVGAVILLGLNMLVWAVLTLWVGSVLAFVGFGLILFALRPWKTKTDAEPDEPQDPGPEDARTPTAETA